MAPVKSQFGRRSLKFRRVSQGKTLKRRLPVAGEKRSAGEDEATGGGASLDSPEKVSRPPDTWIGNPSLNVQTAERSCEMRPGFRGPEESLTACTSLPKL